MGDPIGTGVVTGAVTRIYAPHAGTFRKGKPGGPGRPKGARNRVGADLARLFALGHDQRAEDLLGDDRARVAV